MLLFAAVQESGFGTKRTCRYVRAMSVMEGISEVFDPQRSLGRPKSGIAANRRLGPCQCVMLARKALLA
jgi:hypothetical protein